MFECSACTLRALRAIAGDALSAGWPNHQRLLSAGPRRVSTATAASPTSHGQPYLNAAQLRHVNRQEGEAVEKQLLSPSDRSKRRALQEEMKWLSDPLKFTEHVHYTLRCDKPDKALELCRIASSKMKCIVAWNHCVDWHMKQGQYNEGIRIYNEMKKRGQSPDSYTYTILLRGLAPSKEKDMSQAVKNSNAIKAHSIYTSMSSPMSKVQPAVMHINAALRATARAADLDSFWSIVAHLPEHGPGAADHITYTTILDCIRHDVLKGTPGPRDTIHRSLEQTNAKRIQAINHGRRVWQEVVEKWRSGLIKIDEPLVGAMARLLLLSHRMVDWDDVLSLVQQTTEIPRQIAPIGSAERQVEHVPAEIGDAPESDPLVDGSESAQIDREAPSERLFQAIKPPREKFKINGFNFQYVVPGHDILSVIVEACTMMRISKTAAAYWDMLVDEHEVKPDYDNATAYLKLLKHNRASKKAAKVIAEDLQSVHAENRLVFRLAVEVCIRDLKNRHALGNAIIILNAMEEMLHPTTDAVTLKHFLNLGLAIKDGHALHRTVERLYQSLPALRSIVEADVPAVRTEKAMALQINQDDTKVLLQDYVGALDVLMAQHKDILTKDDVEKLRRRKSEVTGLIGQGVDKYVSWGRETQRAETRRQRAVAARKKASVPGPGSGTRRQKPTSPKPTSQSPTQGDRSRIHDEPAFPPRHPSSRNQEFQSKSREDFDDQFDAINEPTAETRPARPSEGAKVAPRRTSSSAPRISLHVSDRKDHRLTEKSKTMHRQQNRKAYVAKLAVQRQVKDARIAAEKARQVRMARWGGWDLGERVRESERNVV